MKSIILFAAGNVQQAEDRVNRIGQTKPVRSIWISAFPLDEQIDGMLAHKAETASVVLDTTSDLGSGSQYQKIDFRKLLDAALDEEMKSSNSSQAKDLGSYTQTSILSFSQQT